MSLMSCPKAYFSYVVQFPELGRPWTHQQYWSLSWVIMGYKVTCSWVITLSHSFRFTWVWQHMQSEDSTRPQSSGTDPESGPDPEHNPHIETEDRTMKQLLQHSGVQQNRTEPTCCRGRMSLFSRLLSGRLILDTVMSYSSASTEILYGVTQSLIPNTLAWTTPFVIMGLKYKLSCTLAILTGCFRVTVRKEPRYLRQWGKT